MVYPRILANVNIGNNTLITFKASRLKADHMTLFYFNIILVVLHLNMSFTKYRIDFIITQKLV